MAALRDEGVELGLGDLAGPEGSSPLGTGLRKFDLNALMEEVFSKLRAERLTVAEAASLLRCARAPGFLAPRTGAAVLVWGARVVIGTGFKNSSIYSTFNLPKQIHRIRWSMGRFSKFLRKWLDLRQLAGAARRTC